MAHPGRLWWQTGVFYIVYTRSFKDSNGDGVGDLPGVVEKLDYLSQTLGVDAIWVAAVYPSPMADFGYDVSNYTDILPLFGNLSDFDVLIAQAHRRALKVIVDYVPNHSSDQHPWFIESRSSRTNAKRDWYMWADPKPDGSPPNNWVSVFGGPAWEWDDATGQYYMHTFLKEQPDLNWRNPALREAMFNVARFWLERGVDGFRIDCAHHIMKDPLLRDNPSNPVPADTAYKPLGEYDSQLHLYDREHPDVHQVWREFRQLLDSYSATQPRAAFGEIHVFDWPTWAAYYGQRLDELHMPFNLGLIGAKWQVPAFRRLVDGIEAALPPDAWPNYMVDNFDESRSATRYGQAQARVAAICLLTLRGTPTLCYGEEIGMANVPIPPELQQDPFGLRVPGLGRDPYRTPMQWNSGPNAGFSAPDTPHLWLPLAAGYREVNVEAELADPASMLNLYRRLLAYRRTTPAVQWGAYRPLDDVPHDCYVYLRWAGAQRVLVALNFSAQERRLDLPALGGGGPVGDEYVPRGRIVISTHLDREETASLAGLILRGHEGLIVELAEV
jgi:alpha-glucosidase